MTAHKFSRQRELIRNHLQSRCDHPTAEMIYTALKENDPKLSLGTVYRNLRLLSELGQISRLPGEDGPDRFDDALRSCAAIIEHMEITAKGLCPDCANTGEVRGILRPKDPVF